MQPATKTSILSEITLTVAQQFCLRVDVVLSQKVNSRVADAVTSILQGAGLSQSSRHSWETPSCDMEEIMDSLSDIFLELQAMDEQTKGHIEALNVYTCSNSRHEVWRDGVPGNPVLTQKIGLSLISCT